MELNVINDWKFPWNSNLEDAIRDFIISSKFLTSRRKQQNEKKKKLDEITKLFPWHVVRITFLFSPPGICFCLRREIRWMPKRKNKKSMLNNSLNGYYANFSPLCIEKSRKEAKKTFTLPTRKWKRQSLCGCRVCFRVFAAFTKLNKIKIALQCYGVCVGGSMMSIIAWSFVGGIRTIKER